MYNRRHMQQTLTVKSKPVFEYKHPDGSTQNVVFVVDSCKNNDNLYLGLVDALTGELVTDVTVNMRKCEPYIANIKNHHENAGMAHFLIDNDLGFLMGRYTDYFPLFSFDPLMIMAIDTECRYNRLKGQPILK